MARLAMKGYDPEAVLQKPPGVRAFLLAAALRELEDMHPAQEGA